MFGLGPVEIIIFIVIILIIALVLGVGKGAVRGVRWVVTQFTLALRDTESSKTTEQAHPISILFLGSNPVNTDPLRLGTEVRAIDEALQSSEFRDRFELHQQWAVRVADLQGHLMRHRPDLVHFSGHGTSASEIILEDATGAVYPVPTQALTHLFSLVADQVRCVVLNACYSEAQANAIGASIDCVIGMSDSIPDQTAIAFAAAFYQALGYGHSVKRAFDFGISQIALENLTGVEVPVLFASRMNADDIDFVMER